MWTLQQPAYTPWLPQHLNLRYVQLEPSVHKTAEVNDQPSAHVLIDSPQAHLPATLVSALGPIQVGSLLPWLEPSSRYSDVASADLAATQVQMLDAQREAEGRAVTLALQTPDQSAELLTLLVPFSAGLTRIDAHDQHLPYTLTEQTGHHLYQCVGIACNDLRLTLHLRSTQPTRIIVIQSRQGLPPTLLGLDKARSDLAIERQNGDRSMVVMAVEV